MAGMFCYPKAAMERAMKVQEVILRALAKKITWWQAAEIIGISDRHCRGRDCWRGDASAGFIASGVLDGPCPACSTICNPGANWRPTAGKRSEKENQLQ